MDDKPVCSFSILNPKEKKSLTTSVPIVAEKDLSKDQKIVYDALLEFYKGKNKKLLTVGGFAGTGKSTILSCFAKKITSRVAYCAFTGKAASVLRHKLLERQVVFDYCGTIHGMIYIPMINPKTKKILGWRRRSDIDYDLIIVDEGSMVGEKLWRDLQSYNKPILVFGDHGQLSPIGSCINLMKDPMVKLEKIHRQAEGNPIIKLSSMIRNGENYEWYEFQDDRVKFIAKSDNNAMHEFVEQAYLKKDADVLDSAIITYFNASRVRFNKAIRKALEYGNELENDDVLICLKNVYYEDGAVFNGMRGIVDYVRSSTVDTYSAKVDFYDDYLSIDADISAHQLNYETTFNSTEEVSKVSGRNLESWLDIGLLFDYGYALTCHKSQGSSFTNVLVYIERSKHCSDSEFRRWKYTAVTRASDRLVVAL